MSNIDFFEQKDVPQPRDQIKIESLEAKPYPDGWRVRLKIDVTPFQDRPNLEISLKNTEGRQVSQLTVIETMHRHMEFTVHIRGVTTPVGSYTLGVGLYYDDLSKVQDHREFSFNVENG